jgi:hypothetical protein
VLLTTFKAICHVSKGERVMIEKAKPATTRTAASKTKQPAVAAKPETVEKVEPVVAVAKPAKEEKSRKPKMVRDSFTMPQEDYKHIAALKERCLKAGVSAKKSEILRAALICLAGLSDKNLLSAIASLKTIKTGRPAKE